MHEDERDLFQKEMQGVEPLRKPSTASSRNHSQAPTPGQMHRQQAAQAEQSKDPNYLATEYIDYVKPDDVLAFKKDGVQNGVFKNLRLGKYPIQSRLDLHRKSIKQARTEVFKFIVDGLKNDHRTVIIIHGKGEQSQPQQAVLKSFTNKWLRQTPEVLAFHTAQRFHGGVGATYVMLRKSERKKQENREEHQKR